METFGLHWSTFLGLPSWAWSILIVPPILGLMRLEGRRNARISGSWRVVEPGWSMWIFATLAFGIGAFGTSMAVMPFIFHPRDDENLRWAVLVAIFGMSFAALGLGLFAFVARVRYRFNDEGIERRSVLGRRFYAWSDLASFERHWFHGSVVRTLDGETLVVWQFLRGFADLVAAAGAHGIPVKNEGLLRRPEDDVPMF